MISVLKPINTLFSKNYLIKPFANHLSKKRQAFNFIASFFIGLVSLGIPHIVMFYQARRPSFKVIHRNGKKFHLKPAQQWKEFPKVAKTPNFNYVKPKVDMKGFEHLPKKQREEIESHCIGKMKDAMKALDHSIYDGVNEVVKNRVHPEILETMETFKQRILDLYEAYTQVQIDDNVPIVSSEIGALKASGFTHNEILNFIPICQWYIEVCNKYKDELKQQGLNENEADKIIIHLAQHQYSWEKSNQSLVAKPEEEISQLILRTPAIEELSNNFLAELNQNKSSFNKIKAFDRRVTFARSISQTEKESIKDEIARFDPSKANREDKPLNALENDPKYRLLNEIRQRFEWRDHEAGFIGSPLRMLNVLQGKHDHLSSDDLYRIKLFFIYGSKGLLNEICMSSDLIKKVNQKLVEQGKGWTMDKKLISVFRAHSKREPVYSLGAYARHNNVGNRLRTWIKHEEVMENIKQDPNITYAEAERIAKDENCTPKDLMQRFRFQLVEGEEMAFFGTSRNLEAREVVRREQEDFNSLRKQAGASSGVKADTGFYESPLEYQKKEKEISWIPGKHYFRLHNKETTNSPYLEAVETLGLPQYAGISGSSECTFTMAGVVGIQSKEELMALRLLYLPWMGMHEDHTVDEILTALKTFDLDYKPSPDYYKQLYPGSEALTDAIQEAQRRRGFELPDYYLSNEYVKDYLKTVEAEQDQKVKELMADKKLILKGMRAYRHNYNLNDLFADKKWQQQVSHITKEKVEKVVQQRVAKRQDPQPRANNKIKFVLNPQTNRYERYIKSTEPFYKGTQKGSVSIMSPNGKMIPYVPFDWPHLNRVGLLFDGDKSEYKADKFVFSFDANVDLAQKWKTEYTQEEIDAPDFEERLTRDSEEAVRFNREKAHQVTMDELSQEFETFASQDRFIHYNEVMASLKSEGIVGIFTFSRGLPTVIPGAKVEKTSKFDHEPLEHETVVNFTQDADYDRYMRVLGIGKKLAVRSRFGVDVPLYDINVMENRGLTLIPRDKQVEELQAILRNQNGELDGLVRIVRHQTDVQASDIAIRKKLELTIKKYLKAL